MFGFSDLCHPGIFPWTHQKSPDPPGRRPSGGSNMKTPGRLLGSSWHRLPASAEHMQCCLYSREEPGNVWPSLHPLTLALDVRKEGGMKLYWKCVTSARGDASLSTTCASLFSSSHGTRSQFTAVWTGVRSPPLSTSGRISCIQIVPTKTKETLQRCWKSGFPFLLFLLLLDRF